jgi:hypothetical protein
MRAHGWLGGLLALAAGAGARQLDVRCQREVVADTAAVLGAVASSVKGDVIQFLGTCVVNETVPLLEGRGYVGKDKESSRIMQANGANLRASAPPRSVHPRAAVPALLSLPPGTARPPASHPAPSRCLPALSALRPTADAPSFSRFSHPRRARRLPGLAQGHSGARHRHAYRAPDVRRK